MHLNKNEQARVRRKITLLALLCFALGYTAMAQVNCSFTTSATNGCPGLTVNFTKSVGAKYLLRGIRNAADFDYEKTIAQLNKAMDPELETICIISDPELSHISSTIVREILVNGGDVSKFVPPHIEIVKQ